ncbi:hypothetical protein [Flavobacterium sp.]|uniref:hypothetical protein n=1 Tax=Flavobacterium sp. TaxID=239 RepID=UPI003D0B7FDF
MISSTPSKKPAIDEKTTLIAKPALVISLKSTNIDFNVKDECEVLKAKFLKIDAKIGDSLEV